MKVRTIVLVLGILALLCAATGGYLLYQTARESALKQVENELNRTTERLKSDLTGLVAVHQNEVGVMARFEQLKEALIHRNYETLSQANQILDHFAEGFAYDVCYLMDSTGNTIASSNRNHPDSFVGENYAFRPYFLDAIKGRPGVYWAVGVTSGIRGVYFSHPVYLKNSWNPVGVAVIKASTLDLDKVFSNEGMGVALLVHTSGMIFASSEHTWILNLLWKPVPEELARLEESRQFGTGPWNWTGLEKKTDHQVVDGSGEGYLFQEVPLENYPEWRLVHLSSLKAISGKIVDPMVGKTGYLALFLFFFVGGVVTLLYVLARKDIVNRKHAEEKLKGSLSLLHSALESTADGILVVDSEGKIVVFNRRFMEMWRIPENVLESRDDDKALACVLNQLVNPESFLEGVRALYSQKELDSFDMLQFKDGRVFERYSQPQKIGDEVVGRVWSFRDVTHRKRAEDALEESEEKYRSLFEDSVDGIFVTREDGMLVDANQSYFDLFGYTKDEILTTSVIKTYADPSDGDRFREAIEKTGSIKDFPVRLIKRDGTEMDCLITATVRKTSDGTTLGYFGIVRDLTERKRVEEELLQSEERYRSLVENSFDGIFVQRGLKIVFANSRLYEMLGYDPGELEGMDHWLVYHPDYQDITRRRAIARMRGEQIIPLYEVMLQKKDGSSFLVEINARTVPVQGEPGIQVWIRDISGRRRSEEAQRRLATVVEQAAEAIVITDTSGTIQYVNPAFEGISGYTRDEVIGQNPRILQSGQHDRQFYSDLWETITRGKAWVGQFVNKKKDGTLYREDATISPVRDSSGRIVNFVALKRDITREIALQQQLFQAQKMEAIGTLAGGVAHDFNNLLQVVLGYSELLLRGKQEGAPDYAGLERIRYAGQKGAELVRNLLAFSRKSEPNLHPVDLNHEVVQVQKLLSRTIPKTIKIDLHLSGDLDAILADPSQIGQICMNLGVNARDAMPDGGTLTIETATVELEEDYCQKHLDAKPGRYVLLTVSDSGQGMDKRTQAHIFEPFFSTKEVGKGTGLGLATVYGIVNQHGGRILCYSEPGHGTTFKIYFPAIGREDTAEIPSCERPIRGGTETILLVDDEEIVRELGVEMLDSKGYRVITATNGREALQLYDTDQQTISLVILDLIMPEMDGKQCLVELLRINPQVKVLIASGHSANGVLNGTREIGARGFVEKPYNMREFLETVRDVLDGD